MKLFPLLSIAAIASGTFVINPIHAQGLPVNPTSEQIDFKDSEQINVKDLDQQNEDNNSDDIKQEEIEVASR
ncbi:MAG: hypothetical protein IM535_15020 [Pseudanabaena sp. M38BS1SP1A06MG]|nr:hypothetical protein [Pseudanabaena sp. M53BS1SP1A06MG]MCA6593376.1 hypothetical protein [Pseudanabaena sp. M38BS1SP1A06MG]